MTAAMPRPGTVVSRSVGVLKRAGLDEPAACQLIIDVCGTVERRLAHDWRGDLDWVYQVAAIARTRLAKHRELEADR